MYVHTREKEVWRKSVENLANIWQRSGGSLVTVTFVSFLVIYSLKPDFRQTSGTFESAKCFQT